MNEPDEQVDRSVILEDGLRILSRLIARKLIRDQQAKNVLEPVLELPGSTLEN